MLAVTDLWSRHRIKVVRYAGVSVVVVVTTQTLLVLFNAGLGWSGVASNVGAVMLAAVPAFVLNRRWVWQRDDAHQLWGEIIPFWAYSLIGLVASTALVAVADEIWGTTRALVAANLTSFGFLWVGKFILLERFLFRRAHDDAVASVVQ